MKTPKNPRIRNIAPVVAIAAVAAVVLLAVGAAFVFRAQHPAQAENARAPQIAAALAATDADSGHRTQDAGTGTPDAGLQTPDPASPSPAVTPPLASLSALSPAATDNADALASLSPRERAIFDNIPDARFREAVLKLKPAARARLFKALAASPPPKADYASLRVSPFGKFYYVCEIPRNNPENNAPQPAAAANRLGKPLPASVPINQPPALHSRPGSRNVLYLDFTGNNGEDIVNTAWNGDPDDPDSYIPTYTPKPYDTDGNPTTFCDQEQVDIANIWERVSEYYSAFDVDVTTERPATFTRTTGHALITSGTDYRNHGFMPSADNVNVGGVGWTNVFGEYDYVPFWSPVFVYYDRFVDIDNNPILSHIAYAAAHELGHNFGLHHDGPGPTTSSDASTPTDYGYYGGHGGGGVPSWAPIMGAGYTRSVIQFSKGDYYNANDHEDDLAIIAGKIGYRGELGATTFATALPLGNIIYDGSLGAANVIRNAAFSHYYSLTIPAGYSIPVTFTLNPAKSIRTTDSALFGSTDLCLDILDSGGNIKYTNNPAATTNASLAFTLTTGTWYVRVTSTGAGNPMNSPPTGYTAYGSIGQYTLSSGTLVSYYLLPLDYALNSDLDWINEPGNGNGATYPGDQTNPNDWFTQFRTTHKDSGYLGIAAAQSGAIATSQISAMSATVEGTGTFTYWWKFTGGSNDELDLLATDGSNHPVIQDTLYGPGNANWTSGTTIINTTGTHTLTFALNKNSGNTTVSTAWVTDVDWTPADWTLTLAPGSEEALPGAGAFALNINTPKTWTAESGDPDWITLSATAGAGAATITVTTTPNTTASPRKSYVNVNSGGINRNCSISQPVYIPFATALNNNLTWTTSSDAPWTVDTLVTHDGQSSARTGIIPGSGTNATYDEDGNLNRDTCNQTWIQTTVTGTGVLNFWWKVSSEAGLDQPEDNAFGLGDLFCFYIDGIEQAHISGTGADWAPYSTPIDGAGTHTLRWLYSKDPAESTGADAGWLDQVTWTDGAAILLNLTPAAQPVSATTGHFTLGVDANVAWNVTTDVNWITISPSGGSNSMPITVTYGSNAATTARTATITLTSADGAATATCLVTQAAAATTGTTGGGGNTGGGSSGGSGGGGGGGGGGGAPSLWSLLALGALLGIRAAKRKA